MDLEREEGGGRGREEEEGGKEGGGQGRQRGWERWQREKGEREVERERGEGGKWVRSEKGRELSGIQGAEMPSWEGQNAGGLYCVLQFFMSVPKN